MKKIIIILMLIASNLTFGYTQEDLIEYSNLIERYRFHYIYVEKSDKNADIILKTILAETKMLLYLRRNFDILKDSETATKSIRIAIKELTELAEKAGIE